MLRKAYEGCATKRLEPSDGQACVRRVGRAREREGRRGGSVRS